jgi:hypothetical protein
VEKDSNDFLKKLKESLETGKQDEEVTNLHYDILEKADLVKPKIVEQPNDFPLNSNIERIRKDATRVSSERKELEKHAKDLNSLLETEGQNKIIVTPDGSVLPKNEANSKTLLEIKLLENEIKVLESTIDKNKTLIEFLRLQLK